VSSDLGECCRARLPASALAELAPLRATPGLRALVRGDALWLSWPAGEAELARLILALDGAELYLQREGRWHRPGSALPSFAVPEDDEARPLSSLLTPAATEPVLPEVGGRAPVRLCLVASDVPRPTALLRVTLAELQRWADGATSHQLASVHATHTEGMVLLRGERLPALAGERFWGRRVLLPLGRRAEPDVGEDALAEALGLEGGELALVEEQTAEVVPLAAFAPLTRAAVRLAAK
jgi:hypothetical protein